MLASPHSSSTGSIAVAGGGAKPQNGVVINSKKRPRRPYVSPEALAALERAVPSVVDDCRQIVLGSSTPSPFSIRATQGVRGGDAIQTNSHSSGTPHAPFSSKTTLRKQQVLDLIRRYASPKDTKSVDTKMPSTTRTLGNGRSHTGMSEKEEAKRHRDTRRNTVAAHTPPLSHFRAANTSTRASKRASNDFVGITSPTAPMPAKVPFVNALPSSSSSTSSSSSADTTVGPSPTQSAFDLERLSIGPVGSERPLSNSHKLEQIPTVDVGTALVIAEAKRLKE